MTTMETEILKAMAKTSICTFDEVERAYLRVKSFDVLRASIELSSKANHSLEYIVDMVLKEGK